MKKSLLTLLLGAAMLLSATGAKADWIYRSMFPVDEMAGEMTEQLDLQIGLNNRQYDQIFYFYTDWINDVLDEMEWDGMFPMTEARYNSLVSNGFGYFVDNESNFAARKAFFRTVLTRRQYYRWLALERKNRGNNYYYSSRVNVIIYPFGFPTFMRYDPMYHTRYVYVRPPRPRNYYRYDYRPAPRPNDYRPYDTGHRHDNRPQGWRNDGSRPGNDNGVARPSTGGGTVTRPGNDNSGSRPSTGGGTVTRSGNDNSGGRPSTTGGTVTRSDSRPQGGVSDRGSSGTRSSSARTASSGRGEASGSSAGGGFSSSSRSSSTNSGSSSRSSSSSSTRNSSGSVRSGNGSSNSSSSASSSRSSSGSRSNDNSGSSSSSSRGKR